MRMFALVFCSMLCWFLLSGFRAVAQEPREIIQKAIIAHGGKDKLQEHMTFWYKVKAMIAIGEEKYPAVAEVWAQLPTKSRMALTVELGGDNQYREVGVRNGENAWRKMNEDKTQVINGELLSSAKAIDHFQYCTRLTPLLDDPKIKLDSVADTEIEGRKASGVKVLADKQNEVRLYFDRTTGLLLKGENIRIKPDKTKNVTEEFYSEYKRFQGVLLPTRKMQRDGKTTREIELLEYKTLKTIEPSIFARPE